MKDEDWDRVLETNLKGAFLMTRAASKAMVRSKTGGRIINIASTAGAMGNAGQANYSAAKAGLIALTKTSAVEVARRSIPSASRPTFQEMEKTCKGGALASAPVAAA